MYRRRRFTLATYIILYLTLQGLYLRHGERRKFDTGLEKAISWTEQKDLNTAAISGKRRKTDTGLGQTIVWKTEKDPNRNKSSGERRKIHKGFDQTISRTEEKDPTKDRISGENKEIEKGLGHAKLRREDKDQTTIKVSGETGETEKGLRQEISGTEEKYMYPKKDNVSGEKREIEKGSGQAMSWAEEKDTNRDTKGVDQDQTSQNAQSDLGSTLSDKEILFSKETKVMSWALYAQTHVLINGYMRSGSTFIGNLFNFRRDTFFWFEPFWKKADMDFYAKNGSLCSVKFPACSQPPRERSNLHTDHALANGDLMHLRDALYRLYHGDQCVFQSIHRISRKVLRITFFPSHKLLSHIYNHRRNNEQRDSGDFNSLNRSMGFLMDIYNCSLGNHINRFVVQMMGSSAKRDWTYKRCRKSFSGVYCYNKFIKTCSTAKHIVTKTVRLDVHLTEDLLANIKTLKVLQLMRDPRAIINSRINTKWYPLNDSISGATALEHEIRIQCERMRSDIKGTEELAKRYPNRVRIVQYEDMLNLREKAHTLYQFLGMDNDSGNALLEKMFEKTGLLHTDSYRFNLTMIPLQKVQRYCSDVIKFLGLQIFSTYAEMKTSNISSFAGNLPFEL